MASERSPVTAEVRSLLQDNRVAEAERRLGERFDQRTFHDAILALGSVPLPVLEERIQAYIAAEERRPRQAP